MNIRTNIKETLRSFRKNIGVNFLSIFGLAIALAVALLIGLWSINEFSFDRFHTDNEQTYRICRKGYLNNETMLLGSDFGPVAVDAKNEIPGITDFARIRVLDRDLIAIDDIVAYEDEIVACDKNLFQFFSFRLRNGKAEECLDSPNKIVIDQYLANKYFSGKNAMGEIMEVMGKKFQISAIMENIPENSHIQFHMAFRVDAFDWLRENEYGSNDNYLAYLKINESANIDAIAKKISLITYDHFPLYKDYQITHFLQPLTDIHFSQGFRFDPAITNDQRIIFIFISIAVLILAIACFNFINLFISTSFKKAKSHAIRKINGISRTGLFLNSFAETSFYILIAFVLAIVFAYALLPFFNQITEVNLSLDLSNHNLYLLIFSLLVITIISSGIYPAIYVLRTDAHQIIKNKNKGGSTSVVQRILVVSQFAASIILIASTVFINKQLTFIREKDLGFEKEQIVTFVMREMASKYESIRQELLRNPSIINVTAKDCLPNVWNNGSPITYGNNENDLLSEICLADYNYFDMMGLPLVEGRNPFKQGKVNEHECLVNQKTVSALGIKDPIGKQIQIINDKKLTIAGVLKDVNTKSLHKAIDPQVYRAINQVQSWHYVMIKVSSNTQEALKVIENTWKRYNPKVPFEYTFLDDSYAKLYKNEEVASKTVSAGMMIAFALAFMGLFAMAHYATEKRIKEIGVRKVNGAKVSEILAMLNKDFIKWVAIAFVIACPIAYYAMNKWLENFAYKTNLSWWIFALAGVLALGIALLTVSWQSWKAATRNPVEALRYE